MIELYDHAARLCLRIVDRLLDGMDWSGGNFRRGKRIEPRACRLLIKSRLQYWNQFGAVLRSQWICPEPCLLPVAIFHDHDAQKSFPERLGSHSNHKATAIRAAKHLVRHDAWMRIAPSGRRGVRVQVAASHIREPRQLRIEQRHVQKLPAPGFLARIKRRQNSHRRIHTASHVRDCNWITHRAAIELARKTHHSRFGLRENVVPWTPRPWPRKAIPGDAAVDKPRMFFAKRFR